MHNPDRSIESFLIYKRQIETERPQLTVEGRIIALDGINEAGKSAIASRLVEALKSKYGEEGVVLVKFNFTGGDEQRRLGSIVKNKKPQPGVVGGLISAGINRGYHEVILPALETGKIVVIDRSEIDLLRFALESGDVELYKKRLKLISEGSITHRLWSGNRVFVHIKVEEAWNNLCQRGSNSQFDPKSIEEVQKRVEAQLEVERLAMVLPCKGTVNCIRIENERCDDFNGFLDGLTQKIIDKLVL